MWFVYCLRKVWFSFNSISMAEALSETDTKRYQVHERDPPSPSQDPSEISDDEDYADSGESDGSDLFKGLPYQLRSSTDENI